MIPKLIGQSEVTNTREINDDMANQVVVFLVNFSHTELAVVICGEEGEGVRAFNAMGTLSNIYATKPHQIED